MRSEVRRNDDPRVGEILDLILQLASGNLSARGRPSERDDEIGGIIAGLNMLAEELEAYRMERKRAEETLKDSVERYNALFNRSTHCVFVHDFNGRFLDANDAALELLGYVRADIPSLDFSSLIDEEQLFRAMKVLEGIVMFGRQNAPTEYRLKRKDGGYVWVITDASLLYKKGAPYAIQGIARDITERKKAEESLLKSEERYRILVESLQEGLCIVDEEETILFANNAFLLMVGYEKDELEGEPILSIVGEEEHPKIRRGTDLRKKGISSEYEVHLHRKDGELRHTQIYATPWMDNDGQYRGSIGLLLDITEKKKIIKALRTKEEQYRMLFNTVPVGLFRAALDWGFVDVNPKMLQLLNYPSKESVKKMNLLKMCEDPDDFDRINKLIKSSTTEVTIEMKLHQYTGDVIWVRMNVRSAIDSSGHVEFFEGSIEDISDQKRAELDMKKKLMKFKMDAGNIYLVKETVPILSLKALEDLINVGFHPLIVSRNRIKDFSTLEKGKYQYRWLSEKGDNTSLAPSFRDIEDLLGSLTRNSAILVDRLDYLGSKNDFKDLLNFVYHLREIAYLHDHIIILSLDPTTFSEKEIKQVEKETLVVEPMQRKRLPEDMWEILTIIHEENLLGIKPSYTDIAKQIGITMPTVRKRVRRLVGKGFLQDSSKGRSKVVELTERGRNLFI